MQNELYANARFWQAEHMIGGGRLGQRQRTCMSQREEGCNYSHAIVKYWFRANECWCCCGHNGVLIMTLTKHLLRASALKSFPVL